MANRTTNRPGTPTVRHLEQFIEGMTAGVILVDPSGALIGANPAALRMLGVAKRQDLGTTARIWSVALGAGPSVFCHDPISDWNGPIPALFK